MTQYYYETETRWGKIKASSDKEAISKLFNEKPIVIYKESNSKDGRPFITIFRKEMN